MPNNFVLKSFNEKRAEFATAFTSIFNGLNTDPSTPDGMLIDVFVYAYTEIAQAIQSVISGMNLATAEGTSIDNIGKIMGIARDKEENDTNYRNRLLSASLTGFATLDAMTTFLKSRIGGNVSVVENAESEQIGDLEPHSIMVYVPEISEKTPAEIAQAIWDCKPAGIRTFGNEVGLAVDLSGKSHEVHFTKINGMPLFLDVILHAYREEDLPNDYENMVKDALENWGAKEYGAGKDIILQRIFAPIYDNIKGIENVQITATFGGEQKTSGKFDVPMSVFANLTKENISVSCGDYGNNSK